MIPFWILFGGLFIFAAGFFIGALWQESRRK